MIVKDEDAEDNRRVCVCLFLKNLLFFSQGEMPSPLLNLAAESGYCEFVTVLIDEGKVEVDTLGIVKQCVGVCCTFFLVFGASLSSCR